LTIQGQAIGAVSAAHPVLPIEIAFLQNHGVAADLLRRAAEAARRSGSFADEALLKLALVDEAFFYQALAAEIELPFLGSDVPVGPAARFSYSCASASRLWRRHEAAATVSRSRRSARKLFGSSKPPGVSPTGSRSRRPRRCAPRSFASTEPRSPRRRRTDLPMPIRAGPIATAARRRNSCAALPSGACSSPAPPPISA
jgi:hypothetical protein